MDVNYSILVVSFICLIAKALPQGLPASVSTLPSTCLRELATSGRKNHNSSQQHCTLDDQFT